ncbi:MAG: polysaccharide deacetylase family protein [Pseudomonadota bacterium]|nr:polysaccharide deacetylase family protein [Pseudomonadota bacterium]
MVRLLDRGVLVRQRVSFYRQLTTVPVLAASCAIHAGALAAVLARPRAWAWALAAVLANHAFLTAAGLWPRSRVLGPNLIRLPQASEARGEVAITIDDGPDPDVTPRVLAQLEAYGAVATFFCIGECVERYPDLAREIVRRGHRIENHSQRHRHTFSLLGPRAMRSEIARAQQSIQRITGTQPRFFRAPAGLRNPFLDPVLRDLQLQLASWTRRGFDTVTGDADIVYRRLAKALHAGDILLLHDGHAARAAGAAPVVLDVLPRLLETLRTHRLTPVTLRTALQ